MPEGLLPPHVVTISYLRKASLALRLFMYSSFLVTHILLQTVVEASNGNPQEDIGAHISIVNIHLSQCTIAITNGVVRVLLLLS